jgi:flavin reductase (DIM6/NTAB) family NADH-FMN oxidoreductase RutF
LNASSNGRSSGAGADDLRRFFRRHAAAVVVVTAAHQGDPVGLLVSSLASVSASPPLVSFNVSLVSSSWPALRVAEEIGVHVLGADQVELADRFARKGADRFSAPTSWRAGLHGVPVIEGTAAWSIARIEQRVPAGDHVIVVARLLQSDARDDVPPLVHHDGGYHRAVPAPRPLRARAEPGRLTVVRGEAVSLDPQP